MSSHFIPMLSSSPPPIDDADSLDNDDDDDDGFGMFATVDDNLDSSFHSDINDEDKSPLHKNSDLTKNEEKSISVSKIEDNRVYSNETISEKEIKEHLNCDKSSEKTELKTNKEIIFKSHKLTAEGCTSTNFICGDSDECINEYNAMSTSSHNFNYDCSSSQLHSSSNSSPILELSSDDRSCIVMSNSEKLTCNSENPIPSTDEVTEFSNCEKSLPSGDFPRNNCSQFCESKLVCGSELVNGTLKDFYNSHDDSRSLSSGDISTFKIEDHDFCSGESYDASDKVLHLNVVPDEEIDFLDKCSSLASSRSSDDDFKFVVKNSNSLTSENQISNQTPDDDNFGDFESVNVPAFCTLTNADCPENPTFSGDDDDFADFESSDVIYQSSSTENDAGFKSIADSESFANFDDANSKAEFHSAPHQVVLPKGSNEGLEKITKIISAVFPVSNEIEVCDESGNSFDVLEQNSKSRKLWDKLHDVNQTPGIPFQWAISHSFQQLLRSVNVDYHSILRTSTVPFFASGLGLLEPTKGLGSHYDNDINNVSYNDNEIGNKDPIPPVQFDWGSSGLINPLESSLGTSTLMDLTFLTSSEESSTKVMSKHFSLENELLRPEPDIPAPKAPIFEQILSLSANSSMLPTDSRPENLSEEALRVLDQLPDISFVTAKVLMFPVSSNT